MRCLCTRSVCILALGLAGCTGGEAVLADKPPRTGVTFSPDQGGLAVDDSPLRVDFGRAPEGVIAALDRELGPGRALTLDGCGAGISRQVAWGDLVLTFSENRFVGWRQAARSAGQICGALV
ncbi:hypothetical protein GCM10011358_02090 [Sinisalibacter lacisalsi]|uniref:Uncharacterized protein n=1 Tax=Sinisalibacter lacisalsi TaxID=1526570 RepID=A0ABQ1QC12_9RHOB|nr:hypothetical protein GCM10011358_02090 [Sinisalibacter lacisalsi]